MTSLCTLPLYNTTIYQNIPRHNYFNCFSLYLTDLFHLRRAGEIGFFSVPPTRGRAACPWWPTSPTTSPSSRPLLTPTGPLWSRPQPPSSSSLTPGGPSSTSYANNRRKWPPSQLDRGSSQRARGRRRRVCRGGKTPQLSKGQPRALHPPSATAWSCAQLYVVYVENFYVASIRWELLHEARSYWLPTIPTIIPIHPQYLPSTSLDEKLNCLKACFKQKCSLTFNRQEFYNSLTTRPT